MTSMSTKTFSSIGDAAITQHFLSLPLSVYIHVESILQKCCATNVLLIEMKFLVLLLGKNMNFQKKYRN